MTRNTFLLIFGMIILFSSASSFHAEAAQYDLGANPLTLPANTPIKLVFHEGVHSQRNRESDEIIFSIAEDVVVMDRTYLAAGTPVIGRVKNVKPAKSWGRQGTMDVEILSVVPLYGEPVPLTFEIDAEGGSEKATSIGVSALALIVVAPIAIFSGSAISGSSAIIEAGSQITVLTTEEAGIKNISLDKMQQLSDTWFEEQIIKIFLNYSWDENQTIQEAFNGVAHAIDETDITIELFEGYYYTVTVQVTESRDAVFTFQPFEEPHIGKFITLEAQNELAENILRIVPEED